MVEPLVIQQEQNTNDAPPPPSFETIKELMNNCNDINGMKAYGDLIKEHSASFDKDQLAFLRQHYKDCSELIKKDQE